MNAGKKFEQDFKASMPDDVLFIRLKDAGGWGREETKRFTIKNECDAIVFKMPKLFMLELKSYKGKSISFDTCIRQYQLDSLCKALPKKYVFAGYIFNFRDVEETYFVYADKVKEYVENADRKSFPIQWVRENGTIIEQTLKKTRYRYNIQKFIEDVI